MIKPVGFQNNYSKPQIGFSARLNVLPEDVELFLKEYKTVKNLLPEQNKPFVDVFLLDTSNPKSRLAILTTTKVEAADVSKQIKDSAAMTAAAAFKILNSGRKEGTAIFVRAHEAIKNIKEDFKI